MLNLLEIGSAFYTVLSSVHLEDGKNKLGTWYRTELVDAASHRITVCSWLKQTTCTKVSCESKSDWKKAHSIGQSTADSGKSHAQATYSR
jgi:hypothetical protein